MCVGFVNSSIATQIRLKGIWDRGEKQCLGVSATKIDQVNYANVGRETINRVKKKQNSSEPSRLTTLEKVPIGPMC